MRKKVISSVIIFILVFLLTKVSVTSMLASIDITLKENGEYCEGEGQLFTRLISIGENNYKIGKKYQEELSASNNSLDSYVRVIIDKKWYSGENEVNLNKDYIELEINKEEWLVSKLSTNERMILYYPKILTVEDTPPFIKSIKISNEVLKAVSTNRIQQNGYEVISTTYDYNGAQFALEIEVQAIQANNMTPEGIYSGWGVNVSIGADGTLSLIE